MKIEQKGMHLNHDVKQIYNKITLVNLYKDIVLFTTTI